MKILSLIVFCLISLGSAQRLGPYEVIRVVDGDTLRLSIDGVSVPVRLLGIDTPETVHPFKPVEPYGPEASAELKRLVVDGVVYLELDIRQRDKYNRLLAYVFNPEGTFVNLAMVEAGLAYLLTIPPNVVYTDLFRAASQGAQSVGKGVWGQYGTPFVDWNCRDFATRDAAQAFFNASMPGNPHKLDANRNLQACQHLRPRLR